MNKKKSRGRPPGSLNKEYAEALEIPAVCPACRGTKLTRLRGAPVVDRKISGTLPSGYRFTRVIWRRKTCDNCGQLLMVREYVPADNNNADRIIVNRESLD